MSAACSQKVQVITENLVCFFDFVRMNVVGDLVSVHAHSWDLDWTCETNVVVAQVIGSMFNLILGEISAVMNDIKVNRLSSSHSSIMRNHKEVKKCIAIFLN